MPDVVVVGAGIIGCAIARELTSRGVATTVIDARPPGGGATQASAGMLAPYTEAHDSGPLLDLGVRSLNRYDRWIADVVRESGIDVEYRRIGCEKLTKFEWDLRKRVDTSNDALYLSGSEEMPSSYKDLIEQYYRALSKKKAGGGGKFEVRSLKFEVRSRTEVST